MRWCWVNFQGRGVLLIWIRVGQGPIALAVGAGGGCLDIFSLIYPFSPLSPALWETVRYRLKYCLKGPLNPKQPTNLCEKYLQHQQNLYHVFIDFKKAFDRVWRGALWATMRKYNISANLVRTIEQLYDKATSAVQMNGSIGEWFRTTVGVRQGCLLSPTLFNIFSEWIMSDALEEHDGKHRRQQYYQSAVCR